MIVEFFQAHPLVAVFLTVGLGFWLGKVRMGSFSLGAIAATLIVGVVIGQMKIVVPDMVKNVFFLFFLFCTGYSVGPQFVRAMRGPGLKQAAFAVVEALVCAGLIILAAWVMGYNNGIATGLYAGAQTASACLGMIGDTVRELPVEASKRDYLLMIIPACYAVTYVFGTVGTAWFLSSVAPSMMGGMKKVQAEVAQIESEMDSEDVLAPGQIHAGRAVAFRAYQVDNDFFDTPRSGAEVEDYFQKQGITVFVERVRINGKIVDPSGNIKGSKASPAEGKSMLIGKGDNIVIGGRLEEIVDLKSSLGPEVNDPELLNFGAEKTPVTVSAHGAAGITFGALRRRKSMQRVMVASIRRNGMSIPAKAKTVLYPGDVLTLVGWPRDVAEAAAGIGYADRQTNVTDMVFLGLGIAAGCLLGALAIEVHGIPLSLGASVGALIMGLLMGWLRTKHPTFGRIPEASLWVLKNLGVNMFIAVIGLSAGAHFLYGLHEAGWMIFIVGGVCTIVGLVINIFIARKLFRFSAPETLGCVAGGRCSVAAIGAIDDTLKSDVPNLGFTITYAIANVSLVFSSLLVLFLV